MKKRQNNAGADPTRFAADTRGTQMQGAAAAAFGSAVGAAIHPQSRRPTVREEFNPTHEELYWQSMYPSRNYYSPAIDFATFAPAYRFGWESRFRYPNRSWETIEHVLAAEWSQQASHPLEWDTVRPAVADAWHHAGERYLTSGTEAGQTD
jgi:hypothetical protein